MDRGNDLARLTMAGVRLTKAETESYDLIQKSEIQTSKAEALFKRKKAQSLEGEIAMTEYQAQARALRERTARLRALRLARDSVAPVPRTK